MFGSRLESLDLELERFNFFNPLKINPNWSKAEARAVSNLVTERLPEDLTIGIHGTSLHAIRQILEIGRLPAGAIQGDFTEGAIYFEPKVDAMIKCGAKLSRERLKEFRGLEEEYSGYCLNMTSVNAKKHALIYALGLDFKDKQVHDLILDIILETKPKNHESESAINSLIREKQVAEDSLILAKDIAQSFSGVLIGLNERALRDFNMFSNPDTLEAPRLIAPQGLETRYFTGIVALGDFEKEFFDRLKQTI